MAKRIKHYSSKSIYGRSSRRKRKIKKIATWAVALVILFYAGYYLIGAPLINKNNNEQTSQEEVTNQNNDNIITSSDEVTSSQTVINNSSLKAGYADLATLSSQDKLSSHLKSLKENGFNACAFELKDQTGTVLYNSALEQVEKAKTKADSPLDLDMILQTFKQQEIEALPIISAFKDQKAPAKLLNSAIWYQNTEGYLWLDNYADKGGKPWLNPFSSTAKQYICDIENEILSKGFKNIIVENIKFGAKIGNSLAGFGSEASGKRIDAITDFVKKSEEIANNNSARVIFAFDVNDIISESTDYLDGNVLSTGASNIAPIYGISELKNNITIGGVSFEIPKDNPKDVTKAVNDLIKQKLPNAKIISYLTDYDSIKQAQISIDENMEYIEK